MAEWRKVDELFQAAVELPAGKRQAFLDLACAGDAELGRQVDELLAADDRSSDVIGAAVRAEAASLNAEPSSMTGRRIGPYELFRKLGEGGMGAVYLAGRVDDEFRQQVTIKLIKPGIDTESILRRFHNERQILASLNHPHIARLLDGGSTVDGQPYFVMEYIEGEPVDRYCDHQSLAIRERLDLFCKICSAVQFAHQNLIVHRDLKPGNILVNADGEPKLLDFGIAKLLNPELSAQTVHATGIDLARPMTVAYASPEQIRGHPITTATDVYSLGVMLYGLLTGRSPYSFDSYLPSEIERVICDSEPLKPSSSADDVDAVHKGSTLGLGAPAKRRKKPSAKTEIRRRALAGDLDNIILKAMRKEPQRRYALVQDLAEDIRRHLRGYPVLARPSTVGYRAGKFLRRNKLAVALALSVVLFAISMTVQSVRLAEQRDRASREQQRAEKVSGFLVKLFEISEPSESMGAKVTARELLGQGAEEIRDQLRDQPEVQAKLMQTMGEAHLGLGLYSDAGRLFEDALDLRRQVFGEESLEVAETLNALGLVLSSRDQTEKAVTRLRESLAIRRQRLGDRHPLVATTQNDLAEALIGLGELAEAEDLHSSTLELRRSLLGRDHPAVAESLNNLGWLRQKQGDLDAAEVLYQEAWAIDLDALGAKHPETVLKLNNLASVRLFQGDYIGAEPLFREVLERYRGLYQGDHDSVSMALNNLAKTLHGKGELTEAEQLFRQALEMDRRVLGDEHRYTAGARINLAALLVDRDRFEEAEKEIREASRVYEKKLREGDWRFAQVRSILGACLAGLERYEEAEALLLDGYRVQKQQLGEPSPYTRDAAKRLVDLYERWGKPGQAEKYRARQE